MHFKEGRPSPCWGGTSPFSPSIAPPPFLPSLHFLILLFPLKLAAKSRSVTSLPTLSPFHHHFVLTCTECVHRVSKNCAKLFLSELCQISTNFDNFWQKDGKEAKIMRGALIFHLIYFVSSHYRVKRRCSKLLGYTTLKVVICNKLSNDLNST